jgi:mono/diheme cytochrome c family protein
MIPRVDGSSSVGRTGSARRVLPAVVASMLITSLAVAAHRPSKEDGPAAQLSKAPRSAQSLQNPFAGQSEAAAAGHKLFEQHCAQCHGSDARGLEHAADLHSAPIRDAPPGVLFWALRNGRVRKGMPSWSQLPDQQIWQVVTYLKALK